MITVRKDRPGQAAQSLIHGGAVRYAGHDWDVDYTDNPERSYLIRDGVRILRVDWDGFKSEQFGCIVEAVLRMHVEDGPRFAITEY